MYVMYVPVHVRSLLSIVIHGNQTEDVPQSYRRYMVRQFIDGLGMKGTPLRLELRTGHNPFKGRRNKLTERQVNRRKRLVAHAKKGKKKQKR